MDRAPRVLFERRVERTPSVVYVGRVHRAPSVMFGGRVWGPQFILLYSFTMDTEWRYTLFLLQKMFVCSFLKMCTQRSVIRIETSFTFLRKYVLYV